MEAVRIQIEEDACWKHRCNAKLERLKTKRPTCSKNKDVGAVRPSQLIEQEFFVEKTFINPEIYKAIRERDDPNKFVDVLEQVSEKENLLMEVIFNQSTHGGDFLLHVAARFGREKIAELIASHYPSLLTQINIRGDTALHVAARSKKEGGSNVIRVILSQFDAEKTKSGNNSGENKKKEDGEIFITRLKNIVGNTALHEAVTCDYLDAVILLIEKDDIVTHQLNNVNKSPLYKAIHDYILWKSTGKEIIDCLLKVSLLKGKPWFNGGHSPLHAVIKAVSEKNREQWLPVQQLSVTITVGVLPIICRAIVETASQSKVLLEEIIEKRSEAIYFKDEFGGTPLHFAAFRGYLDGVRILLKRYPLAALECDKNGDLPIHLACKSGKIDVVKELLQQECPYVEGFLNQKGQTILHVAAMHGKHDVVKYILKQKNIEYLNQRDRDGNTPLHVASMSLYPMVLFYLTRKSGIYLDCRNKDGLMARDIVLQQSHKPKTYREFLSHAILSSANAYCTEWGYKELQPHHDIDRMKDLVNTLMLVAILIATVTFAAGFTVPGSIYGSDDPNPQQRGVAVLAKRTVFQIFMICNTVAMYSSTVGSFILLWAQRGDYHLASSSFNVALRMVGLALTAMSGAFMAAAHLVVHNVSWLTILIRAIGTVSILFILVAYILFIFPFESHHPFLRPVSDIFIRILIPFSGSYEIPQKKKSTTSNSQEGNKDKDKDKDKDE